MTQTRFWPGSKWRWLMPLLFLSVFFAILIWLPWKAQRLEAGEKQEQLIADTLWVEQAIQFQLKRNDEVLRQIGVDFMLGNLSLVEVHTRFLRLQRSNHEIESIAWLANGDTVLTTDQNLEATRTPPLARRLQAPVLDIVRETRCLQPEKLIGESKEYYRIRCQIPLLRDSQYFGLIEVSYLANNLLEELVPWWFAQENQIMLSDYDDQIYATRTAGGVGKNVYIHSHMLDLPGLPLILRTNSTKSAPKLLSNLLVLLVVLLSLGLIWSLVALWRDITRRLRAEGALRQQIAFRSAMENSLVTGLRARDMLGRLTYVNPAFCRMVGFPADEIVGHTPPMPYWAPEAYEEYQARFSRLLAGSVPQEGFETIYRHANGARIPVLIYESPLIDESGRQSGWMSSILDLSELKRAQELTRQQEEKLHASARLATMGEIASMLAHEINQPLAAIASYSAGAMNLLAEGGDAKLLPEALTKIHAQTVRAGQIVRSVHEFVKKREPKRELVDLSNVVAGAMPLIELQAKASHTQIHVNSLAKSLQIRADQVLIEQVLLNLTRNALEAMQPNSPKERILHVRLSQQEQTALVEVIDRGHGISPEVAARLFSPFFSTKESGMGMGLNICRTAIEFHGGSLNHSDNPQGGAIFGFSLPLA